MATARPENVPTATVELDRPRALAFTLGAMRRIKEQTGRPFTDLATMAEEERLDHLHEFVWAALVNEDREGLTPADVEEMIHVGNLESVIDALAGLMGDSTPMSKGAEGNAIPKGKVRART